MKVKVRHWVVKKNPLTRDESMLIHKEATVHKQIGRRFERRGEQEGAQYYFGIAEGMTDTADQYREHFKAGKGGRKNPPSKSRFKLYTGPSIVHVTAERLRRAGFGVYEGVANVFIDMAEDYTVPQATRILKEHLGPQWGVKNLLKLPLANPKRENPVGALKEFRTKDQYIDLIQQAFRSGKISLEEGWAILNRLQQEHKGKGKIIPFPKRNPPGGTLIYSRVISIVASKAGMKHKCDPKCKAANHVYRHVHIKPSGLWGLHDGRLLIAESK